ncbi:MAG TPA: hypothetical protein PLP17_12710, partial [Oligoflexia bacterium]|nr:hypothetical protein [Oligoflexia bacterium]
LLTPDIFSGYAVLCAAILLSFWCQVGFRNKVACFLILVYGCAVHISNPLTITCLLIVSLVFILGSRYRRELLGPQLAVTGAVICAVFMFCLVVFVAERTMRERPVLLPFLAARIIGDGFGEKYLREECPRHPNVFCAFLDSLPQSNGDFLFSSRGVVASTTKEQLRAMSREQFSLFLNAWRKYPVEAMHSFLRRLGFQLLRFPVLCYVLEHGPGLKHLEESWPAGAQSLMRSRIPCLSVFYVLWSLLVYAGVLASIAVFFGTYLRSKSLFAETERSRIYRFGVLVFAGVIMNAAVCSLLSGAGSRYQARVIWLLPLAAAAVWLRLRQVKKDPCSKALPPILGET